MAPWLLSGIILLSLVALQPGDAKFFGKKQPKKIRAKILHQPAAPTQKESGVHESRTANATLSSVLSRAAAAREELGYKDIMMAMMDSSTATYLLPHFLSQLHALKTGVQKSLVLVALDETAMAICRKLHAPELCHLLDVSSLQSQEQHDYYIDLGWKKTELIRDVLLEGHSVFFSDMDIVYFKDPLANVAGYPDDILVADDHQDNGVSNIEFNPYQLRGEANIGTLVMRPSEGTLEFVKAWLGGKEAKRWDRTHFTATANVFVAKRPSFHLKTLDINVWAFACPQNPQCGNLLVCSIARYAKDWRTMCAPEYLSGLVSLHLACADKVCGVDMTNIDREFMYGHIMGSLRTLQG